MLYPLISLFLFFQTIATPASLSQEDCEICQEEFSQLDLSSVQKREEDFLKAQAVLECYDEIDCPPPGILLICLASYDIFKKLDLQRAEKLMVRLRKGSDQLNDSEFLFQNVLFGNLQKAKGDYKRYLEHFQMLENELPKSEIYCQYRMEYFKNIADGFNLLNDYENELLYLLRMQSTDCERNKETFLQLKSDILAANMNLGRHENFESQALELKEGYLKQKETISSLSVLNDMTEFFTKREKEKAFKYSQEYWDLVRTYSDASLTTKNNALKVFIQSSLRIKAPEISLDFAKYIEQRDSILIREKLSMRNQALLEYNTLEIASRNKQLLLENEIIENENEIIENRNRVSYFFIAFIVGFSILFIYYLYNRNSKRELRLKLEKVLARDEERNNLAKKLHDEVATDMALLSQKLRDENLRKNLLDLRGNIRGISHELSTEDFEEISFEDQIKNLMVDMMDLGVQLNPKGLNEQDWTNYSNGFKKMLYLVIKEAVVNAQTHGKAKNIDLVFDAGKKSMLVGIKDDGIGFDTEAKVQGIGIRNMKKRVKEVDGLLEILSSPGNGAEFKFTLPIER